MGLELSGEKRELKSQLARMLAARVSPSVLRKVAETGGGWSPEVWRALAEMGVLGIAIPEEYGGVGLPPSGLCVVAEELGRVVAPVPFHSSICLAAEAIRVAGNEDQKRRWLPSLASGEVIGTFAWSEGSGPPGAMRTRYSSGKVTGSKWPIADASIADIAVVVCADHQLAIVDLSASGASRETLQGFDQIRVHGKLTFHDSPGELLEAADPDVVLRQLTDRAAIVEAFEQIGGCEAALFMARDYTLRRFVFARPLASYQAVKHNLANIFVLLELARSNALFAARQLDSEASDIAVVAATARLGATQAYEVAARENLQLHGGIGFTWEADCHFHYRRARLLALNLGSVEQWQGRLVEALSSSDREAA